MEKGAVTDFKLQFRTMSGVGVLILFDNATFALRIGTHSHTRIHNAVIQRVLHFFRRDKLRRRTDLRYVARYFKTGFPSSLAKEEEMYSNQRRVLAYFFILKICGPRVVCASVYYPSHINL
jgi:hypothetical protein